MTNIGNNFAIRRFVFEKYKLHIEMENHIHFVFPISRSIIVYKEGDLYEKLENYNVSPVYEVPGDSLGLFKMEGESILRNAMTGKFNGEAPTYYWLLTADECIEIAAFAEPDIIFPS